jgi:hypothetical protein
MQTNCVCPEAMKTSSQQHALNLRLDPGFSDVAAASEMLKPYDAAANASLPDEHNERNGD